MAELTRKEDSIFWAALEIAASDHRDRFLDVACADNPKLRAQIDELLTAYPKVERFLEQPAIAVNPILAPPIAEQPGTVIGSYKLLEQIGEGGFGVVFLAEQERPVRRKVALKVIKPGMDSRQVISRFEAERQALAMMDHPNIAKVYDAGATENGRPYFVMELVQGVPITEYCDQCNLTTNERLELFILVCQALQHAHQKGVIHRDIKPTNVLVAMQDGRPTPKVIDFGVAKAIDQKLTEQTLTTAFVLLVGSPLYMSPEQAELSPLGVDTRSDIYSLGVLLYELLIGTTPFDKDRLHAATFDEFRRIIREEEPPRPSARFSTLSAELATTVAVRHRTDVRRLEHAVRGELDWIVMKCLEKDRNRRYETPNNLARDIERYLHDEPVQACPPSASYRFRKFARRNKTLLATGGAIAAALFIGLGLTAWMYVRAATESVRAQAVSDLLQEMLGSADAGNAKGVDYKVRELLDDFSAGLGSQLLNQPEVEADIHATIGRAYCSLRLPDKAQPHFEKAIQLRRRLDGQWSEKLAAILVDYAWNLHGQQRYSEAESQLKEALEIDRQRGVTGGPVIHALSVLQHVLISSSRDVEAEHVTEKALAIASHSSEEFADQATLLHRYADMKIRQGHFSEGEKLAHQAVDLHRRLHGDQHPETAWALRTLASALLPQQKLAEAESALRDSVKIFRRQFPEDHLYLRGAINDLRTVLEAREDKPALEGLAKEEADAQIRSDSPDYHVHLAEILLAGYSADPAREQREDEAHRQIRRALEEYQKLAADSPGNFDHLMKAADGYALIIDRCRNQCGFVPSFAKEVEESNRRLTDELPKLLAAFPDSTQSQWETAMCYSSWGRALYAHGIHLPTSEHAFSEEAKILEKLSYSDSNRGYLWIWLANSYSYLGDIQWRLGKLGDAESAHRRALTIYDEHATKIAEDIAAAPFPGIELEIVTADPFFAYLLASTQRKEEAAEHVHKAAVNQKRLTNPLQLVYASFYLALAQVQLGDETGYRATCKALVDVPLTSANDLTKRAAIWTWCLAPVALEDMTLLVKRAEEFVATNTLNQSHYALQTLGAVLYRAGQFDRAAEQLNASIAAYPSDPLRGFDTINYTRLLLAMTQWQQGRQVEARHLLSEAQGAIDLELQNPTITSHRRVEFEVLRREAEALIGKVPIDEAKEERTPSVSPTNP